MAINLWDQCRYFWSSHMEKVFLDFGCRILLHWKLPGDAPSLPVDSLESCAGWKNGSMIPNNSYATTANSECQWNTFVSPCCASKSSEATTYARLLRRLGHEFAENWIGQVLRWKRAPMTDEFHCPTCCQTKLSWRGKLLSKLRCNNLGYMAFLHICGLFDFMFHECSRFDGCRLEFFRGRCSKSRLPCWTCEHPGHWMGEHPKVKQRDS